MVDLPAFVANYQIQITAVLSLLVILIYTLTRPSGLRELSQVVNLVLCTGGMIGGIKIAWNAVFDERYHELGTTDWIFIFIGGIAVLWVSCSTIWKIMDIKRY